MTFRTPHDHSHVRALLDALADFGPAMDVANRWGTELADAVERGHRLLAAGNGGSAAQAQHLTGELVGRYRDDRPPYSAICLNSETSTLTAIGNDYPAEELFARQVEAHGRTGDVLVLLSTSGRSANVLAAARRGRDRGLRVWALTGRRPNPLAEAAEEVLEVPAAMTCTVQELHLVALHVMCAAFDARLGVSQPEDVPPGEAASIRAVPTTGRVGA